MKLALISLLFIMAFMTSCQTTNIKTKHTASDLILSESLSLSPPENLTADQVTKEVALTCYALESGYGGRKYIPKDIFQKVLIQLREIKQEMPPTELKDRIDAALWLIPDNHLKARLNGKTSPTRREAHVKIDVGQNAIKDKSKFWEVRVDKVDTKKILYISITSFPSFKDSIWNGFIEKAKEHLKETDAMVLDLRSNGGGDDTMGYKLAELMFGGLYDHPLNKAYLSQTPETFALASNTFRLSKMRLRIEGQNVPAYYDELIKEQMDKYNLATKGELPAEEITTDKIGHYQFNPQKGYNKPIYILLNSECASSCESTTDAFEPHPKVKRVGSHTMGMIHFGNVGALILPFSKIQVQIPTKTNEYFDKRFFEKIGIKPDVEVPPGQDAYLFVKKNFISK